MPKLLAARAAVTRASAKALRLQERGVIAPGHRADFVLLPEDSLGRIGAIDAPDGVRIGSFREAGRFREMSYSNQGFAPDGRGPVSRSKHSEVISCPNT